MKISKQEKEKIIKLLMSWGERAEDIPQIFRGKRVAKFEWTKKGEFTDKKISCDKAFELLGFEDFWSGISRASFHWSAYRYTLDGTGGVYIDCSALFKDWNK